MEKTTKKIVLGVHKNSIEIADDGRDGEVRYFGEIDNDMKVQGILIQELQLCLAKKRIFL